MFSFMELIIIYWHLTPFRQKQKEEKKEKIICFTGHGIKRQESLF